MLYTDSQIVDKENKILDTENVPESHIDSKLDTFAWKWSMLIGHLLDTFCKYAFCEMNALL